MPQRMFYLPKNTVVEQLALGREFDTVYPPEGSTNSGWRITRFRVIMQSKSGHKNGEQVRAYEQLSRQPITPQQVEALWELPE